MPSEIEHKPSALVPFFLGLAPLAFGIHLFTPEVSDTPELIFSGVLISVGVILLARSVRNFFYKPDERAIQIAARKATVPFIERRKPRQDRRSSATRRWIGENRHAMSTDRRSRGKDRRSHQDRRVNRRDHQKWEDPSVLHPVKPTTY